MSDTASEYGGTGERFCQTHRNFYVLPNNCPACPTALPESEARLRALALEMARGDQSIRSDFTDDGWIGAAADYYMACSPSAILPLLDELTRLRASLTIREQQWEDNYPHRLALGRIAALTGVEDGVPFDPDTVFATVQQWRASLAEAARDSERLDWLEVTPGFAEWTGPANFRQAIDDGRAVRARIAALHTAEDSHE